MFLTPEICNCAALGFAAIAVVLALVKAEKHKVRIRICLIISIILLLICLLLSWKLTVDENNRKDTVHITEKSILISQNKALKDSVVVLHYAIKAKESKIADLQNEIDDVAGYAYFSTLNYFARSQPGNEPSTISGLAAEMSRIFYKTQQGAIEVHADDSIAPVINGMILHYPKYPFPYYAKYVFLKKEGDEQWKTYAQEALDLFKITTNIKGHDKSHDIYMKYIMADLNLNTNTPEDPVIDFNYSDNIPQLLIHKLGSLDSIIFKIEMSNHTPFTAEITTEEVVFIAATKNKWSVVRKFMNTLKSPIILTQKRWQGTQYSFLTLDEDLADMNFIYIKTQYTNVNGVTQKPFQKIFKYNPKITFDNQIGLNEVYALKDHRVEDTLRKLGYW